MMDHSTKFTKQLVKEGYEVNVALNPKNKFYYVYIFSTYDVEEAKKVRNRISLEEFIQRSMGLHHGVSLTCNK